VIEPVTDNHATPLRPEERDALIPTYIMSRGELNELEQRNIATADVWAFGRKHVIFRERFLKGLHRRMFNRVWRWAGEYRTTARSIGVEPHLIQPELWKLLDEARHWIELKSFPDDEVATRFHHRLVWIHPFPDGNGRWSRLAADALIVQLGGARFTWGRTDLRETGQARTNYIEALKLADKHQIEPLIAFVHS
jgi:Fic-DOC domain mobile mystery protein B